MGFPSGSSAARLHLFFFSALAAIAQSYSTIEDRAANCW